MVPDEGFIEMYSVLHFDDKESKYNIYVVIFCYTFSRVRAISRTREVRLFQ